MDLQALVDGMSVRWQSERAKTQMTLGKLIKALEAMAPDAEVAQLQSAHSYRGYYSDLAFELGPNTRSVQGLLSDCRAAMGQVFEGYKGGDFVMGALTPLWVAEYGDIGKKIIALRPDGTFELAEDEE